MAPKPLEVPTPLTNNGLPVLKKGELATDGYYLYLCREHGKIEIFIQEELFIARRYEEISKHINMHHQK